MGGDPRAQTSLTLRQRQVPLAYLALLPTSADELSGIVDDALATNPMLQLRKRGMHLPRSRANPRMRSPKVMGN